jgi:hypothetical protein
MEPKIFDVSIVRVGVGVETDGLGPDGLFLQEKNSNTASVMNIVNRFTGHHP